jgi:phosphoserine phosphatase
VTHLVTLISNPERPAITLDVINRVRDTLWTMHDIDYLNERIAADIPFDPQGRYLAEIADDLEEVLAFDSVDIFIRSVESLAHRRKRLFLADMDSTMIEQECIDELADYVGLKAEVSAITERAMRGEIAFEPALRERVALLKGLPVGVVDEIIEGRVTLMPGGRTLVRTMRAHGAYTCLVSGGFTAFTGPIAARIGFDEHRSNRLVIESEALAGRVDEPILGREAKLATLVELRDRLGLQRLETLAVGDGANDLAMLGEAGLGIAYRAKPAVAAAAHARIEHGDLTALLYLQGYRADEFVED